MSSSHPRQSSVDLDSPGRPFDNIINFRDVGRTINQLTGKRVLKEGIIFRSARLDDASERDKRRLVDEFHISTVVDLRSRYYLSQLNSLLFGKAFERTLLWRLDWWNFFKVLALVASGYRSTAVQIVGQQVMSPRGLVGLGIDTLDSSYGEMKTLFDLFSSITSSTTDGNDKESDEFEDSAYPVLIHCTQGKDRTGLIVLLLLLLVADVVPEEAMREDYLRSEGELAIEMEERMKEVRLLGLSEDYTKCPRHFVETIRAHLEDRYGGVEGYLGTVGVGREQLEKIRRMLLA
ncbi:Major Facilitator Superfamily protein [Aspergillus niger]|uniref:Major Facilitator Superfamily protein n=1 Tax=Aspergillus niger TaxID=5061 RepID=A0A505HSF7_ASPNG|nr:Major Facilitator Superfamily protein [Aspergillus niger]